MFIGDFCYVCRESLIRSLQRDADWNSRGALGENFSFPYVLFPVTYLNFDLLFVCAFAVSAGTRLADELTELRRIVKVRCFLLMLLFGHFAALN